MRKNMLLRSGLVLLLTLAFTGETAFADTSSLRTLVSTPSQGGPVQAAVAPLIGPQAQTTVDGWTIDNTKGEVLEDKDGWTHFKSSSQNGNSTTGSSQPAIAVYGSAFDFRRAGSFHAAIRSSQSASDNRFGFYLGYKSAGDGLFIGFDSSGWFWQKYAGGDGDWYQGARLPAPVAGSVTDVTVSWTGKVAKLNLGGKDAFEVDYSSMNSLSGKVAMRAATYGSDLTDIYIRDFPHADTSTYSVKGSVASAEGPIVGAKVRIAGLQSVSTDVSGDFTLSNLKNGKYTLSVGKAGYTEITRDVTLQGSDVELPQITLVAATNADQHTRTLTTDEMEVRVKERFPAVLDYTMIKLGRKKMYGQSFDSNVVNVNGTDVKLSDGDVKFTQVSDTEARYLLSVKNDDQYIDAELTVDLTVKANTLGLEVTGIKNNLSEKDHPIQTIAFPRQSLVSVQSNEDGAQFTGARMSSDTNKNGDTTFPVTDTTAINDAGDYAYGFVSGGSLSAGLWSNSEHDGTAVAAVAGGAKNTRVIASTVPINGETSLGLESAPWYYHRVVTDSKNRSYTVDQTEMPKLKVAIAADQNKDGVVDWEDGALAYRSIMNNPVKSQEVPDLVSYRIAMNFGSQAQNPFLTTLDNVKKVSLNTDGLGQSVLLKGYANEGHDSGHPDYGDIGQRIGGAKDMNTLLKKGADYGARFGVHVNAGEMYPEAKAFNDELVRRNPNGSLRYGWNWLDQAVGIDSIYDLTHGRANRFQDLKNEVGDNLDFIYVDIWGNQTGGSDDSWQTRKLSKEINDRGWRMANEWGAANEYDSTFQHWAADLTYGGSELKGENSQVMRFLRNHQKDSWVGDYPSYGGAANAPLLGGYDMKDFEGWQGRNDYAAYILNLYTHDVSTKFLQHFTVQRWVNSPLDAASAHDPSTNGGNEQIALKDADGNTVVVSRKSNDPKSSDYRQRTITLNGRVISNGAVRADDGTAKGSEDESYLLPWLWDAKTGKEQHPSAQRLYHWNTKGGQTTWALPDGWNGLSDVKVYRLTDQGKTDMRTVPVSDGKVTLNADANTPYVVYQGVQKNRHIAWSEGMHVVDAGFNGGQDTLIRNWHPTLSAKGHGAADIVGTNNAMLRLSGAAGVSQSITDLTPGKRYVLYVGVDKRGDGIASINVTNNGKTLASNYTDRSIAYNYVKAYAHNKDTDTENGTSLFQNMMVWFIAPSSGSAQVTLSQSGTANAVDHAYFDDVRILENDYDGLSFESDGTLKELKNDFESNPQGMWPFVESGLEGVEDNRSHLSELHAPYTQAGWDVKKMDDVLQGKWSLKVNGLADYDYLVYQTIPQTVHLEPGEAYEVSFDYQSGSDGIYAFTTGEGQYDPARDQLSPLKKALGTTAHARFTVTGAPNGDSWFGISSTDRAPDLQGSTGKAQDFGGYKDFILDNLVVRHLPSASRSKADTEAKLKEVKGKYDDRSSDFSATAWRLYQDTLAKAQVLINKDGADEQSYTKAYSLLESLDAYMQKAPGNDGSDAYDVAVDKYTVEAGSEQELSSGGTEGPAILAQDGKTDTFWHTQWGVNAVQAGSAWYQFDLSQPTTIDGLRYLPRSSGANGRILKYNIDVSTADGGETYAAQPRSATPDQRVVTDGTFTTRAVWQKVKFPVVIKNVTAVRISATQTDGDSGQENNFASAAELRITTKRAVPDAGDSVDKTDLGTAIDEASGLNQNDYTSITWNTLAQALAAARTVFSNENSTLYDVLLSQTNLLTAIGHLVKVHGGASNVPGDSSSPGIGAIGSSSAGQSGTGFTRKPDDVQLSATGSAVLVIVAVTVASGLAAAALFVAKSRHRRHVPDSH